MKRTSAVSAGLVLAFLGVVAVLGWRSRAWPLIHDAPIMQYVAWRIAEGAVPYRDVFDMNSPGVYLIHLLALGAAGAGDAGWRLFDLGWLLASAVAIAAYAAPWGAGAAAGGALFFAAYHLAGGAWQAGQRDFFLSVFLLLGALGVARWAERRRGHAELGWAGLALGAGITVKPHAAALAAALGLVVLVAAWRAGAGVWAPLATFAAAAALLPLAVVAWLAAAGALPAWRQIVVEYLLPLYSRLGRPVHWAFYRWPVWIPIALAVGLSLVHAAGARRFGPRHWVAVLGLAYGVAHYVGQGKGWEYHLYPLAAFAAVLLFCELEHAVRSNAAAAVTLVACLVVTLVLLGAKGAEASDAAWIAAKARLVRSLVGDLERRLRPGERVQVLDTTDGGVHALLRLGVAQPTRFLYDFHFFHDVDHPTVRALRAELVRDLAARPPRYVVVFERGWPGGGYERLSRFPELWRWLQASYRAEPPADGYTVYAKRDGP